MAKPIKILMVGPFPPPIGGVRVSFQQLINDLANHENVQVKVLNLPHHQGNLLTSGLWGIGFVKKLVWFTFQNDVVALHATTQTALLCGPLVWLLCKLLGKKSILRKFGGNFDQYIEQLPLLLQWLMRKTTLDMDLLLFQTKHLVNYFQKLTNKPVIWFSNSRPVSVSSCPVSQSSCQTRTGAHKFIFLGQVKATKGIYEIIEAYSQIQVKNKTVTVDIYGPLDKTVPLNNFSNEGIQYKGILPPQQVISTLRSYDALLLPTYHPGEGYPGVILESYAAGIPVIATNWNAIPEIVDQNSGILIAPRSSTELSAAMLQLIENPEEYNRLREGASNKAVEFSSQAWANKFVNFAQSLVDV